MHLIKGNDLEPEVVGTLNDLIDKANKYNGRTVQLPQYPKSTYIPDFTYDTDFKKINQFIKDDKKIGKFQQYIDFYKKLDDCPIELNLYTTYSPFINLDNYGITEESTNLLLLITEMESSRGIVNNMHLIKVQKDLQYKDDNIQLVIDPEGKTLYSRPITEDYILYYIKHAYAFLK